MMTDWVDDVAVVLGRLEELLDRSSGEARAFLYARDILRVLAWLRTQPPRRVLLWGVLGVGTVMALVLVGTRRQPPTSDAVLVEESDGWAGVS